MANIGTVEAVLKARDEMTPSLVAAAEKVARLREELEQLGRSTSTYSAEYKQLNMQLASANQAFDGLLDRHRNATQGFGSLTEATNKAATASSGAAKSLGEINEQTQKGIDYAGQFERLLLRMAERMVVLWAVRGAYEFVQGVFQGAAALERLHTQTGITLAKLQELQFAATQTDTPFKTLADSVNHMDKAFGDARVSASQALTEIGLNLGTIFNLNPDQRLTAIVDAIAAIPDASRRASAEVKLFGTDAVDPAILKFHDLATEVRDVNKALSDEAIHILADASKGFHNFSGDVKDAGTQLAEFLAVAAKPLQGGSASGILAFMGRMMGGMQGGMGSIPQAMFDAIGVAEMEQRGQGRQEDIPLPAGGDSGPQRSGPLMGWDYINFLRQQSIEVRSLTEDQRRQLDALRQLNELTEANGIRVMDTATKVSVTTVQYREYTKSIQDAAHTNAEANKVQDATEASIGRTAALWDEYYRALDHAAGNDLEVKLDAIDKWEDASYTALMRNQEHNKNFWEELTAIQGASQARRLDAYVSESERIIEISRNTAFVAGREVDRAMGGMPMLAALRQHMIDIGIDPTNNPDGTLPGLETGQQGAGSMRGTNNTTVPMTAEQRVNAALGALDFGSTIERAFVNGGIEQALQTVGTRIDQRLARAMDRRLADRANINGGNNFDQQDFEMSAGMGAIAGLQIGANGGSGGQQFAQMGMAAAGTGVSAGVAAGSLGAGIAAGAVTMGIGAAVIGAIMWYRAEHPPEWQLLGQELGRDLGVAISQELAENIADNAENLRSPMRAQVLRQLGPVIEAAGGLNPSNIDAFTQRVQELSHFVHDGALTVAEATRILDDNFDRFAAASTNNLGEITHGLREIIEMDEQMGTNSSAIRRWEQTQAKSMSGGINSILALGGTDIGNLQDQAAMARMGIATSLATGGDYFDTIRGSSAGLDTLRNSMTNANIDNARAGLGEFSDDVRAMATHIHTLQDTIKDFEANDHSRDHDSRLATMKNDLSGLTTQFQVFTESAGDHTLFVENQLVERFPQLIDASHGLATSATNMYNLGLETTDMFATQERVGYDMYTRLQGAVHELGGDTREALIPMQGWLHAATEEASRLGVPLDQNTQMMVNQSKELGIWSDKGERSRDVTERLASAVERLVNWLDHIPEHVDTTVTTHFTHDGDPNPDIPDQPVVPPTGHHAIPGEQPQPGDTQGPYDDPIPPPGVYHGGPVRYLRRGGPVSWRPAGRDTVPAMLDPEEGVVTASGMSRIGESGLRAINQGTLGRSSGIGYHDFKTVLDTIRSDQAARDNLLMSLPGMIARQTREYMQEALANY